jgi:aarF domain-containing kinase
MQVGQFIASSPSIFPAEYVREFEKCLDRTDPVPWAEIKKIIEQDLGRRLSDVYSYVNTVPLASASVAQVYEARLRTGEDCVIKVQKPGVANVLKTDLGFLYIASRAVELVNPEFANRLSLGDIVGDIRQSMLEEVDFILEAKNLDEFASFLASEGLDGTATCPMVFRQATSRKVLTMQRLRGVPLTNLEAIREVSQDPEGTLISALNVWNLSVMRAPFFHADVHAGNLLVLEDGRIGFIDFGIVGRMGAVTFEGISILADALVTEDFAGMARGLVTMGATLGPVNMDSFAADLEVLYRGFSDIDPATFAASEDAPEITELLLNLVRISEKNGLKLPREFGLLVKQQLYFTKYNAILAPTLDPLRDSRLAMKEMSRGTDGGPPQLAEVDAATIAGIGA